MAMEELGSSAPQTFSPHSFGTPLLISIMGISATALAILMYHLLVVRYCMRRQVTRMVSIQTFPGAAIPTGVDEKTLLTIPVITYTRGDSATDDQCECTVCLGDIENGDKVRMLPNCKHLFHVKCIDEWFAGHTSCPVCRVPVVAPDDEIRSCPVCRSSVGALTDDRGTSVGSSSELCEDRSDPRGVQALEGESLSRARVPKAEMLRHCNSLVLPGERKGSLLGMELKRSLSMGHQSNCVAIDISQIDCSVDNDCSYYSSIKDQSIRRLLRVSSRVRQSISRMCVGQGSDILPY